MTAGRVPHNVIIAPGESDDAGCRAMNPSLPANENPRDTRALARFAAVQAVVQGVQHGLPMVRAAQQAALQPWAGRYFAAATIEDWYYDYRKGQFAALQV